MARFISFIILGFILILSCSVNAQNVHPSVQAKIDSLQAWIQTELNTKGTIDQVKLDEWNKKIRDEQERVAKNPDSGSGSEGTPKDARVKTFSGYVGTAFTVPKGKRWRVKRMTVSGGMGEYNILVTSVKYDKDLNAGEVLSTPSFTAEASMVAEDQSNVLYTFEIMEFDIE